VDISTVKWDEQVLETVFIALNVEKLLRWKLCARRTKGHRFGRSSLLRHRQWRFPMPNTRRQRREWNTEECQFIWFRPEIGPFKRAGLQFDDRRSFAGRCRAELSRIQQQKRHNRRADDAVHGTTSERESHFYDFLREYLPRKNVFQVAPLSVDCSRCCSPPCV